MAPVLQTWAMTPSLIVLLVAVAAAGGVWLAWNVVRRSQRRQRAIRDLLDAVGWRSTVTHPDLTGRDRATTAVR